MEHPRLKERDMEYPQHAGHKHAKSLSLNDKIAVFICKWVGTMYAAYLFTIIAFIALPQAIESHSLTVLINWFSGNWMQFVLLPIIIVGQDLAARLVNHMIEESFKNSKLIYKDNEALLQMSSEIRQLITVNNDLITEIHRLLDLPIASNKKMV